jgi:hypothetical protein
MKALFGENFGRDFEDQPPLAFPQESPFPILGRARSLFSFVRHLRPRVWKENRFGGSSRAEKDLQ